MTSNKNIANTISKSWNLDKIQISHNIIDYKSFEKSVSKNDTESVRLHFGLKGSYEFEYNQLAKSFHLSGHHNNIMYSKGLEIEVKNKSKQIETFGINFNTTAFLEIAQHGNDPLKKFADSVLEQKNCILSNQWKTNTFKIQQVIKEILNCPYENDLKNLFLVAKSMELLVLQADLYDTKTLIPFIKTTLDKRRIIEAKELLSTRINTPPTIVALSKLIGINEYKLKKGFKELFGITIFSFIHQNRMILAKKLLLNTHKSIKEIAYEVGFSSPQHFSTAFKKEYGITPNSVR